MMKRVKITYKYGPIVTWPCEAWAYTDFLHPKSTVGLGTSWEEAKRRLLQALRDKQHRKARAKARKPEVPPREWVQLDEL